MTKRIEFKIIERWFENGEYLPIFMIIKDDLVLKLEIHDYEKISGNEQYWFVYK